MTTLEPYNSCVYLLFSTRDISVIKYIGVTSSSPYKRLSEHKSESKKVSSFREKWINKELKCGFDIIIYPIITNLQFSQALKVEMSLIKEAKELGLPITNTTNGGDGYRGKHSVEHNKKVALSKIGKPMSKSSRDGLIKANTGRVKTKAEIKKRLKHIHVSVIQIKNEEEVIWESPQHVLSKLKIDPSSIIKVCKGKRKTAGGFKWKYKNGRRS